MKRRPVDPTFRQDGAHAHPLLLLMILLLIGAVVPVCAYAQTSCEQALSAATRYYNDARFEEAIGLLKGCLEQGAFSEAEQLDVYTLLSMLCFANREEAEARQAIRVLLSLKPDYQPDPIRDQPSYRALVEDVRGQMQPVQPAALASAVVAQNERQGRRGLKKWLYAGGGAILTGAAFLLINSVGQSNQDGGPNPPPPRPPGGQ